MISRVYTPQDLLYLRFRPFRVGVLKKLNDSVEKNPDLRDIIRIPNRALNLIAEEDEECLAIMSGGSVAALPIPHPTAPGSSAASAPQLDGTVSEWKYRGRNESDHTDVHPACAPAGTGAQKDEGFQKFYKAVVSPTHVRVTAGGRIVPNTRGSSSPTGKWAKDRATSDTAPSTRPQSRNQSEPPPYAMPPQGHFPGFAPMVPGYSHGMAPRMVAGPALPMMPMPMAINMGGAYSMPPPMFRQPQANPPMPTQQVVRDEKKADGVVPDQAKPIQISPPEHFDRSRPFFYNGHWVMPQGQQYYSFGSMPGHPFQVPQMNGQMVTPYGAMFHPAAVPGYVHPFQPAQSQPPTLSPPPTIAPRPDEIPVSSIRLSKVTKKQLEYLRNSLRYYEDQLLYNRHQIDEKETERCATAVRDTMERFEKTLQSYVVSEAGRYPKGEKTEENAQSTSTTSNSCVQSKDSKTPVTSDAESDFPAPQEPSKRNEQAKSATFRGKSTKARAPCRPIGGVCQGSATSEADSGIPLVGLPKDDVEKVRKVSALPTNAALAPPFQPRTTADGYGASSVGDRMASGFGVPRTSGQIRHALRAEAGVAGSEGDFAYNRELTPDELRARHMYWGKSLQCPQQTFESSISPKQDSNSAARRATATQSESFAAADQSALSIGEEIARPDSCLTQVSPNHEGLRDEIEAKMMALSLSDSSPENLRPTGAPVKKLDSSTEESDSDLDGQSLIFRGRQAMGSKNKHKDPVWQSMMKGKPSAHAAPGKVSPMTAQGVLPNYAGHATASLSPAIANTAQARNPSAKMGEQNGNRPAMIAADKRGENRHPANYLTGGVSLHGSDFGSN